MILPKPALPRTPSRQPRSTIRPTRERVGSSMHDQENLASSSQSTAPMDAVTENGAGTAADAASTTLSPVGSGPEVKVKKKKKKKHKALEDRTVYEAGAIIVCDSKVVLR